MRLLRFLKSRVRFKRSVVRNIWSVFGVRVMRKRCRGFCLILSGLSFVLLRFMRVV